MTSEAGKIRQDKEAGLTTVKDRSTGRFVALYDESVAIGILERVASGELLRDICSAQGMPHETTFRRWVINNPKLARAWDAAVKMSAATLEEEALAAGRKIKDLAKKATGIEVRAYEVAMNQLRWSAARRDPGRFGERAPANITVPIQINSTLDLGSALDNENIYKLAARVPKVVEPPPDEPYHKEEVYDRKAPRKRVLTPPGKRNDNGTDSD